MVWSAGKREKAERLFQAIYFRTSNPSSKSVHCPVERQTHNGRLVFMGIQRWVRQRLSCHAKLKQDQATFAETFVVGRQSSSHKLPRAVTEFTTIYNKALNQICMFVLWIAKHHQIPQRGNCMAKPHSTLTFCFVLFPKTNFNPLTSCTG